MTFNANVPNAGQSPGLFPPQNNQNFTNLKNLINRDHIFNDTLVANDNSGTHRQVTLTARATPGSLPTGTNGIFYSKLVSSLGELFWYDGTSEIQISTYTVLSGTVAVTSAFSTIVAIPANKFGEIYLYKGRFIQAGAFVSDGTVVNGYSYAEKYVSGSGASQILELAFDGNGASALNLRVKNPSGSSFDGTWTYKVYYRSK